VSGSNQNVTVSGSSFQSGLTVSITFPGGGGTTLSGSQIQSVSSGSFVMVATLSATGTWSIRVNNPDGGQSNTFFFNVQSASTPGISSVSPASPTRSDSDQNVLVSGSNFVSGLTVTVFIPGGGTATLSGSQIQSVSSGSFTMVVTLNVVGQYGIRVNNPGGAQSNTFNFTTQAAVVTPSISSISPASPTVSNSDQNVSVSGSNFVSGLTVTVFIPGGGTATLSGSQIQSVSSGSFTMVVTLNVVGQYGIRVNNPGGAQSNTFNFTTQAAVVTPSISSISPASPTVSNSDQNVSVSGSNFQSGLTVTVFIPGGGTATLSGSQIQGVTSGSFTMVITLNVVGQYGIRVNNPGGAQSNTFNFSVQNSTSPPPTISGMTTSPNPPLTGQQFNFTITGTNYDTSNAEVFFLGPGCSTSTSCVVSALTRTATQLSGPATLAAGSFTVQVRNGSAGTPSGTWPLTVGTGAGTPTISNMTTSPNPPVNGQQFNFTITGLNYNTSNAEVFFLGPGCSTATACVVTALTRSATTLTGPATLAAGYFTVQVRNGSGGTPSGTWPLIVGAGAGTPTISNMTTSPNPPVTGQQFNFTITGLNYNTSNAEVFFLGPGCSTATSCVVTPTRAATTLTGSATLATGSFTVQVRNGPGGMPSGTWPLSVNAATGSAPLQVIGIEVTQGIQNLGNSVALIQDKRTFVRVHVKSLTGIVGPVQAELIGTRIGLTNRTSLGTLTPDNPGRTILMFQDPAPQRANLNDSFYFELPNMALNWRRGTVELEFKGVSHSFSCGDASSDACKKVTVTFEPLRSVDVRFIGIGWRENGVLRVPSSADFERAAHQIEATFPVTRVNRDYPYNIEPKFLAGRRPVSQADFEKLLQVLLDTQSQDGCIRPPQGTCTRYYFGVILPPTGVDEPADSILGMAESPTGGNHGSVAAAYLTPSFTVPHELAHNTGRRHTARCGEVLNPDIDYQPSDGSISLDKSDRGYFGFDIFNIADSGISRPYTSDIMSYCRPRWMSPYTYNGIKVALDKFNQGTSTLQNKMSRGEANLAVIAGQQSVQLNGSVSLLQATGEIASLYVTTATVSAPPPIQGIYAVRFEGSQGQELSTFSFEPAQLSEGSTGIFSLILPWNENTTRVVLLRNGQTISSRNASNRAPTVTVLFPNGGDALSGSVATIRWAASDPDGDPLNYVVQYSVDGGMTWQTLVTDLNSTSYDLDLNALPGTSQGLVRVLATDGFYTAQDQSDSTFSVNSHLPQARIQSPQNSALYVSDQTVILEGDGFDADDGQLGDAAMSWSSSLDGALGGGRSLSVNASALKEGTHTISLTARDSDGQTGSASVTIQVSRTRPTLAASLSVSPTATSFAIGTGSIQTAPDIIAVRNNGDGNLNWSASADQTWIRLSSATGSAPANLSVSADPTGLSAGQYAGHVTVTTSDAPNSPQTVNISLNVVSTTIVQLSASSYTVTEGQPAVDITLTRTGDTTSSASVGFATNDSAGLQNCNVVNGIASSRCDYISTLSTVNFGPGETSKTISILIVDDAYAEGTESFTINLSSASGATLGTQAVATININDNDSTTGPNPNDVAGSFVTQHYFDFLNRQPDVSGLAFWTNQIASCGSDQACIQIKRINVSAAFYVSVEFQQTGYLVERTYKAAYGDGSGLSTLGGAHQLPVPIVRFNEFLPDTQRIGQGVVVNVGNWQQQLEDNKQAFLAEFVQRSRFTTLFPASMTAAQFVDKLNTNAGNPLSQSERDQLVSDLSTNVKTRAQVLRAVAEDPDLNSAEFNRAFVLMQYFGYLRRNPNDPQDTDYTGYDFWLTKLNQFNGNFVNAEMVKAFIVSGEYRQRFGP
jgi:hypothetical protein